MLVMRLRLADICATLPCALCLVPGQQFGLFAADVVGEQVDLHELLFFIVTHEAHAAGVDEQAAFDATSA